MQPFDFGDGPGGWLIVNEPELHLSDDVVVPDIAGWRRLRMPVYPPGAYVTLAPDWVCEVLSPSTRKFDLGQKRTFMRVKVLPTIGLLIRMNAHWMRLYCVEKSGYRLTSFMTMRVFHCRPLRRSALILVICGCRILFTKAYRICQHENPQGRWLVSRNKSTAHSGRIRRYHCHGLSAPPASEAAVLNPSKPPSAAAQSIRRLPVCCLMLICAAPKWWRSTGVTTSKRQAHRGRY